MPTLQKIADIVTGDIVRKKIDIKIDDVRIDESQIIKAAIIDTPKKTVYIEPINCLFNSGVQGWVVEFSANQTAQLLQDPDDLTSNLLSKNVLLEVQVGTPYNVTLHWQLSVEKGLIN